jgi:hypothetical protein
VREREREQRQIEIGSGAASALSMLLPQGWGGQGIPFFGVSVLRPSPSLYLSASDQSRAHMLWRV